MTSGNKAFVLPFLVLMATVLMVLLTLLLDQAQFELWQAMMRSHQQRSRLCVKLNTEPLIAELERALSRKPAATFLMRESFNETAVLTTGIYASGGKQVGRLSSGQESGNGQPVYFTSSFSPDLLMSEIMDLETTSNRQQLRMAWAFEDVSLTATDRTAADWWPLPDWLMSVSAQPGMDDVLKLTGIERAALSYVPEGSPLPYAYTDQDPLFAPVLREAKLKFGIFASGLSGQREKVIRLRFYVECSVWNPYSRAMKFHDRTGLAPVFQLAFHNLPLVRIINDSKGVSTGWIDLDTIRNSQSGTSGIHAWIRLNNRLHPGETVTVTEPDTKLQPEGLARIVHPAFMVSPADRVRIEFKQKDRGIALTCLQLDVDDPVSSADNSSKWLAFRNFLLAFPELTFPRADEPDQPFYLDSGSLSFRRHHAQLEIVARKREQPFLDPRIQHITSDVEYPDAKGSMVKGNQMIALTVGSPARAPSPNAAPESWPALVSWPDTDPLQLIELADFTQWENAFCMGAQDAVTINSVLDTFWPFSQPALFRQESEHGRTLRYAHSIHINSSQAQPWMDLLSGISKKPTSATTTFLALYPTPITVADYHAFGETALKGIAGRLANRAVIQPVCAVSDFFNKGKLTQAITDGPDDKLLRLLQLRGLNGKGYQLSAHGSVFILHAACFIRGNDMIKPVTARIWLLMVPNESTSANMKITRFEWTDPDQHIVRIN